MFEYVYEPPFASIDTAVDALHQHLPVALIVNKAPDVWCVFTSTATKEQPYGVSYVVTAAFDPDDTAPPKPMPMSLADQQRIEAWARKVVPTLLRRWRKKHPPQLEN